MTDRCPKLLKIMLLTTVLVSSMKLTSASAARPAVMTGQTYTTNSVPTLPPHQSARRSRRSALTRRTWGIEVIGVHLVSAGYMLEFRYHVLDAGKAKYFADRKIKPFILDQKSGAKLMVPSPQKIGALRNSGSLEAGRNYWMLFANPGRMVKPGAKVDVVVGEFQAKDIVVN